MATPEERSAAASEQTSTTMANLVATLTAQQAAADKKARDGEKREAAERQLLGLTEKQYEALLDQRKKAEETKKKLDETKTILEKNGLIAEENETYQRLAAEHDKLTGGNEEKRAERERKLLGQSEKQYEATLAQRKVAEDAKKELDDTQEVLGDSAEGNEKYQKAKAKFDKEEAKAKKLEGRRNLLSRFKETRDKETTGAAVKELGGTALKGIGKTFKKIGGFLGQFSKIFSILVIPALVLLVNSPAWGMLKKGIENLIDYLSSDDNFLFGKNGIIKKLRDKFGDLNVAIGGVLGLLTLKFLGFSGLKVAFLGFKAVVLAIKGAFVTVLTTLATFFGIGVAPFVAIIAAIAAVGYALFDTFKEVKKKFLEGAGVGELIQTAVVQFVGAFGKILDFAKNLLADVLEFFGFEDIAKKFREFSFEKIIEDGLNKVFDFFKKILDFDFMGFIKKIPFAKETLEFIGIDTTEKPKLTPEQEKIKKEEDEAQRKKTSKIRKLEDQKISVERIKAQKRRVAKFQTDVDDPDSNLFSKETPEEQAADREKLLKEKEKLERMEETQAALEREIAKAKAAPINISAPNINTVNEAPKTENNVTNSSSLKGFGTVGALAGGAGRMYTDD